MLQKLSEVQNLVLLGSDNQFVDDGDEIGWCKQMDFLFEKQKHYHVWKNDIQRGTTDR